MAQGPSRKRGQKDCKKEHQDVCRESLRNVCANKTDARAVSVSTLASEEGHFMGPTPRERIPGNHWLLGEEELSPSQG